jgi:hypothetical protein
LRFEFGQHLYLPPRFSGRPEEDIDEFVKDYRLYFTAAEIATNNPAGKQRALLLFQSCLKDDTSCWYETNLYGKKWHLNYIRCGNTLANMAAVVALNNANITAAMIAAPDGTAAPALLGGATGATVIPVHNVHTDEDWEQYAGGCPVDAAIPTNAPNGVLNNNNYIVLPDINISQVIIHETKIKMAKMAKMVEIISIWTLPKVGMAKITSYYIILIRYK